MTHKRFFIIGCGKCGTTSLAHLLANQKEICFSKIKEPNFFSNDSIFERGIAWYNLLFSPNEHSTWLGEASVSYALQTTETKTVQRIFNQYPNSRFIYIARDPFKRLLSVFREHHNSGHRKGWFLPFNFKEALEYRPAMLENTRYWSRTAHYRSKFSDQSILYLTLEDLQKDPISTLRKCQKFLDLQEDSTQSITQKVHLNRASEKRYDTKFLRMIRTTPIFNRINRLPNRYHNLFLQPFRRKFIHPMKIKNETKAFIYNELKFEIANYLDAAGKSQDFWKKSI